MRIRSITLACLVALAAAAPAIAHDIHFDTDTCGANYQTAFDVAVAENGIDFSRNDGHPQQVFMHDGHLRVDGHMVTVSDADAGRLRDYERQVRALVPEVAAIAREGIDIGFSAMTTVAAAFAEDSSDRERIVAKLTRKHAESLRRLDASLGAGHWKQHDVDDLVEEAVGDSVSELVGTVTGSAVSAALSGDSTKIAALEARTDALDGAIDKEVKSRSDKLEIRAKALCPHLVELDTLQKQWQFRLADGSPLVLMTSSPSSKNKDIATR
jgi:hypothetical protein